ncbi:MAG: N-6 DNA methylase, partial [Spirochaetia bacterium]|nr:N-6 DNA methylase [Spirochaetia bacterium]
MSLFQKSVEKKYLSEVNEAIINSKYAAFQEYFGNPERQENIRNSKEEQFQEGFLRELFVNIFEYTLNPEPDFNLTTELKNVSNSRKVDGAVLNSNGDAIAVIELKSTTTTDLDSIETQAFGYKNHQPKCVYVITSNFEKLRFYIEDAIDFIDFDLFNLSKEQFALLWLCLAKDSLLNNRPLEIKKSSIIREEDITKKLYTDYSAFRKAVFNNLVKKNPDKDKLLLFKKTQKLLDRFLFIFFAEDRLLLPPNSISRIIGQWKSLKDLDEYKPLYSRFVKYFGYMDKGFKGKDYDIFAYNGGLFKPDEVLDNILIDNDILLEHSQKLSTYNFDTDVDVNILGHIFEHSLVEIESIHAEINGEVVDSNKSKRKKDGIFYTPKYITQYIVENTIGRLCRDKRVELGLVDEEYARGRKNRKKDTVIALDRKLSAYKDWLLGLTILDPACGSGAFLNQALDFLIGEHNKINVLDSQLHEESLGLHDIETDILERNIYGVDINEESVEIAKLSLWLRTAQKGRKLNTLNNNIKCGNSLIDDPEVAGDKAFKWEQEFPDVFAKGGFDVVIGNPPYVRSELLGEYIEYFENHYKVFNSSSDLFAYFYELGSILIKESGIMGYISNTFDKTTAGKVLRKYLTERVHLISYIDFTEVQVFESATT